MDQGKSLEVPKPTAKLQCWETYLQSVVESKSVCRVRTSHLEQTAQQREQVYLKRLAEYARSLFSSSSLSHQGHALQKQVLELIKLRRRYVPDDSPDFREAAIFLAVVQLHHAVESLLEKIDYHLRLHSSLELQLNEVVHFIQRLGRGQVIDSKAISPVIQMIRNNAADSTIDAGDWLLASYQIASLHVGKSQTEFCHALAGALQSSFLAARIFRKQALSQKIPFGHCSLLQRFGIQPDSFLTACLLKDVGIWQERDTENSSTQIHHAELSAGLLSRLPGLQIGLIQVVRQHHECFDGSGLPLGIRKSGLHIESRLLAVLTRWTEIFNQHLKRIEDTNSFFEDSSPIETVSNVLILETKQNRWEKMSTDLLLDAIDVCELKETPETQLQAGPKSNWRVPRPHFLDSTRRATPVTAIRKQLRSLDE